MSRPTRSRRRAAVPALLLTVLAVTATGLAGAGTAAASTRPSGSVAVSASLSPDEDDFAQRLNETRAAHGLRPLAVVGDLTDIARRHSGQMAAARALFHNDNLGNEIRNWNAIGENVGTGTSVQLVHDAFVRSSPHLGNILDPRFTEVGIGVGWNGGWLYVTEDFRQPLAIGTGGAIGVHFYALGGYAGFLGAPTSGEYDVPGGRAQNFLGGVIFWSPATGAREVHGALLGRYLALGGPASFLGLPVTDEVGVPGGRASHFVNGSLYWSPATGVHEVHGALGWLYHVLGGSGSFLGLPVRDEAGVSGGRVSYFQTGAEFWSAQTGAHEVHGRILSVYQANGGAGGRFGFPVSNEYAVPGGRRSDFQGAALRWDAATNRVSIIGR